MGLLCVMQLPLSRLASVHAITAVDPLCLANMWYVTLGPSVCSPYGLLLKSVLLGVMKGVLCKLQAALPKAEVRRSTRAASRAASQHHSHSQQQAPTVSQPPSPGTPPEPLLTAHQDPHLTNADPTQPTAQQAQHAERAFETGADHAIPADGSEMQLEAMQGDNDNGDACLPACLPIGTAQQADTQQSLQQSQMHTQLTSQEAQEAGLQEGGEAQLALALQPSQEQGETSLSVLNLLCASIMVCTLVLL